MSFVLPPKNQIGTLDPEIAQEGTKVIYSDGETIQWTPPPPRPVMPDWSQIKSIARYFNRHGFQPWPAWVYHPSEEPRLLKDAKDGEEVGIVYRRATADEHARYGMHAVWDWSEGSLWRPQPYERDTKFDPKNMGQGKTLVHLQRDSAVVQNDLVRSLVPTIAAAVAQALQTSGPAAPANVDKNDWNDFLAFKAYQKTQQAADIMSKEQGTEEDDPADESEQEVESEAKPSTNALSGSTKPVREVATTKTARVQPVKDPVKDPVVNKQGITPDAERTLWEEAAQDAGIEVDSRWSLKKLKEMVEKAAA